MSLVDSIHEELWRQSDCTSEPGQSDAGLPNRVEALVADKVPLASASERARLVAAVVARVSGLGPLQPFADDPAVTEIMVNAGSEVWVERSGELIRVDCDLRADEVEQLVRRLASSAGRSVDRSSPSVDVRLADGSRLHAILPPLAIDGPSVTIRRFSAKTIELDQLTTPEQRQLLTNAVKASATIVVAGATASGKTTLLNALAAHIEQAERLVTVEDAAELRIPLPHVVRLESRIATPALGGFGVRELVRQALRMRPDRIICGEMRGAEALDLVQAMNTGHEGSLTTVHANSPADAMRRIETMMLLGDADLPLVAIREQLASCVDLVVMMRRTEGGRRVVDLIAEVPERSANGWTMSVLADRTGRGATPQRHWADEQHA